MAITFKEAGVVQHGSTSLTNVDLPDVVAGDLIIFFAYFFTASLSWSVVTPPSGYTLFGTVEIVSNGDEDEASGVLIYTRRATGSDALPSIVFSDVGTSSTGVNIVYEGAPAAGDIFEDWSFYQPVGFAADVGPIVAATATSSNSVVICGGAFLNDVLPVSALTGDSLTWVDIVRSETASGQDRTIMIDSAEFGATPSLTDKTFDTGSGSQWRFGFMLVLAADSGTIYEQAVSGTIGNLTGAVSKGVSKILAGVTGVFTGVLTDAPVFPIDLDGFVGNITGSLSRHTNKSLSGIIEPVGAVGKTMYQALAGVVGTISGVLSRGKSFSSLLVRKLGGGYAIIRRMKG